MKNINEGDNMVTVEVPKWRLKTLFPEGIKYRKKPVVIEAVQFLGFDGDSNVLFDNRPHWLVKEFGERILFFGEYNTLTIKTLEGDHLCMVNDYIIKGVHDELYPCKPDIFKETYEKVE